MAIGVDFILKASTDGFTAGLGKANAAVSDLKSQLKSFGAGQLAGLIGVGGLIRGFTSLTESAQKTREEMDKAGKSIPENIRALAAAGDNIDKFKTTVASWSGEVLGFFDKVGKGYGGLVTLISNGFDLSKTRKDIKDTIQTANDLEDAQRRIAEANKKRDAERDQKGLADAESKVAEARRANAQAEMSDLEKILSLEKELAEVKKSMESTEEGTIQRAGLQLKAEELTKDIREQNLKTSKDTAKIYEDQAKLAKDQKDFADEGLGLTERKAKIESEILGLTNDLKNGNHTLSEETAIQNEILELQKSLREANKGIAQETLDAEQKLTEEKKKQAEAQKKAMEAAELQHKYIEGMLLGGANSGSLSGASDAEIQDLIQKNQVKIQALNAAKAGTPGMAGLLSNPETIRLENESARAQNELNFRSQTRTNLGVGEGYARRMYAGDPLNFDNILSQLRSASGGLDDSKKTQVAIGDIRDVLVGTLGKKK